MDKKIIFKYCLLTSILFFAVNSYAQKSNEMQEKVIFNKYTDTIVDVEGKEVLIRFSGWAFGLIRIDIQVYLKHSDVSDEWMLLCTCHTNTTKINLEINQEQRKMVFKSKSNKVLMILPFETFNFTNDW